jgi:predicted solute-binding protein
MVDGRFILDTNDIILKEQFGKINLPMEYMNEYYREIDFFVEIYE